MAAIQYTDTVCTGEEALQRAQAVRALRKQRSLGFGHRSFMPKIILPPPPPPEPLPPAAVPLGPPDPMWHPSRVIQRVVAHKYGMTVDDILRDTRFQVYVVPRFISMYLCHQLSPELSWAALGRRFARDHSTVIHGIRKIKAMLWDDQDLVREVEDLKREAVKQLEQQERLKSQIAPFKPVGEVAAEIVERLA